MKKIFVLSFLLIFISQYEKLSACSCEWNGPFLKVAKGTPLVVLVNIKKYLLFSGNIPMAMEVEILVLLKGDDTTKTVKVWGDSGMLCRPYLSRFQSDSVWVMALFKSSSKYGHPDEKEGDYFISGCGTYYLGMKRDTVTGLIQNVNYNDPPQNMSLQNFIATAKQVLTSIEENTIENYSYYLEQNYPNPFNPTTKISYSIKEDSFVILKVYNLIGEEVQILVNRNQKSGKYSVEFSGYNLPSGFYFYRIQAGNSYQAAKKMILLK